jgi:hypothetical protein
LSLHFSLQIIVKLSAHVKKVPVLHSMCEFFIEPPPDTHREERQGKRQGERERKRNMGFCVLLSVAHRPPSPLHHLSPTLHAISPARGRVIRTRETGEIPPHTLTPLSLSLQRQISRMASNLEVERILKTSTFSCNEEEEEITKPPTR